MLNTGYNKQSARVNVTQQFTNAMSGEPQPDVRALGGPARRDGQREQRHRPDGRAHLHAAVREPRLTEVGGSWATNPFGPANPFADAAEIQTPEDVGRFIGGGNIDWTPFTSEHQSLKIRFIGGVDVVNQRDQFYAPPDLQVERLIPTGLPGHGDGAERPDAQYLNYSINLIHHYTPSGLRRDDVAGLHTRTPD